MKSNIERNTSIVDSLESDINGLMESKADKMKRLEAENIKIDQLKALLAICGADILDQGQVQRSTLTKLTEYFSINDTVTDSALETHIEPMGTISKVEL